MKSGNKDKTSEESTTVLNHSQWVRMMVSQSNGQKENTLKMLYWHRMLRIPETQRRTNKSTNKIKTETENSTS